ncbi:MAG: PorP/SprF family type IX secretion system membrane protein [Bacteroidetes bacterium]|nr:PorP/SprF family type IX secretion system membrane protein [Bacteroidota bacterium]
MRKILIIWIFGVFTTGFNSFGQQLMLLNHYDADPFIINPAFAGIDDHFYLNLNYRKQWTGFTNSPSVYYVNANSLLGDKPAKSYEPMSIRISDPSKYQSLFKSKTKKFRHGLGATIQSENYGQIRRFSSNLSYAFHLPVGKKYKFSAGVTAGLVTYNFSSENLTLIEPNDKTFNDFVGQNLSSNFMNFNGGLLFYSDKLQIGYSARQILRNQIWFVSNSSAIELQLHHYVHSQYSFSLKGPFVLKAGFLLRYTDDVPLSLDLSAILANREKYWGGFIYRINSAMVFLAGMKYRNTRIGYSFDVNTNALVHYNSGSHEILIGLVF